LKSIEIIITIIVIMNKIELYAWISHAFGREEFGIDDFRAVFPTSQAPKVIHDLVGYGYLERVERGKYRAVNPENLIKEIVKRGMEKKDVIKGAKRKYAYCESSAVSIWTDGYYWTGFTKGFIPIHVKVRRKDLNYWERFFRKKRTNYTLEGNRKTLYGVVSILHPEEDFEAVKKNGYSVIPLEQVVKWCLEKEMIYQPALEYLDQEYGIGYRRREYIAT